MYIWSMIAKPLLGIQTSFHLNECESLIVNYKNSFSELSVWPAVVSRKNIAEFLEVGWAVNHDGLIRLHCDGNARHDALDVTGPVKTLRERQTQCYTPVSSLTRQV